MSSGCRVPEPRLDMGLRVRPDHERQRAQKIDRGITSEDVIDKLLELFAMRGVPRDGELPTMTSKMRAGSMVDVSELRLSVLKCVIDAGSPSGIDLAPRYHEESCESYTVRKL